MISTAARTGSQELVEHQAARSRKPRVAVVSPFLDKSHGTERMVIEWLERLSDAFEFHVYSQHVEDLDLAKITWHRVPTLPGPHLFNFLYWFGANRRRRARDSRKGSLPFDIVFSPGTNCTDADAVTVHIVFAEFVRRLQPELKFARKPIRFWLRLAHRRIYYRTVMSLERRVFQNPRTQLILTAPQTAEEIARFFQRHEKFPVVSAGLDHSVFNPERRAQLRAKARESLKIADDRFALLLVGNDWRKKGLGTLILALEALSDLPIDLFAAGRDDPSALVALVPGTLRGRLRFLPPRKDVEFYYAAADAYTGPSLEDTFALPASEAMACGLPVIISARAGAAALVTHGSDGLILSDPTDAKQLAALIRRLYEDRELRERLGKNAVLTAQKYTWEQSASDLAAVFNEILRRRGKH